MGTHVHMGRDPSLGDTAYVADEYYLRDVRDFPADLAHRVTARCVARWSDWYSDTRYWGPKPSVEGALPESPDEREAFVDALFDEPPPEDGAWLALSLKDGERWTLDAHDGFPAALCLLDGQFEQLQQAWAAAGLPTDLYCPALERRIVIEPAPAGPDGPLIRQPRYYSPLQWQRRDHAAIAAIAVPTEEERSARFRVALGVFCQALWLHMREVAEATGSYLSPSDEWQRLMDVQRRLLSLSTGGGVRLPVPTAGWSSTPTLWQALESALPAIRRLEPSSEIVTITGQTTVGVPPRTWKIDTWDLESRTRGEYEVKDGIPYAPAVRTEIAPWTTYRVGRVASRRLRPFIDSDEAMRRAEEAGGRAFWERTGATRVYQELRPARDGGRLRWQVAFTASTMPGLIYGTTLSIDLDARTGQVIRTEEEHRPPEGILMKTDGTPW